MSKEVKPNFTEEAAPLGDMSEFAAPFAQPRYDVDGAGVWYIGVKTDREGNTQEATPVKLSSPIEIIGRGTDNDGAYYRVIRWQDANTRRTKTAAIPKGEIVTGQCWARLGQYGIDILSGKVKRERLSDYLQTQGGGDIYTITDRAGWHGNAYILPNGETINAEGANILYNGDTSQREGYTESGSLEEWRQEAARYAEGNSRLCLALGLSLAAPFLALLHEEGGGVHLAGSSSKGKTTAANLALSVWGSYEATKSNWDTTALGLQNAALARNDGFLALDEIGQTADPRRIPQMVYSVINGISKTQGAKDGGNRKQKTWRNLILSTGETNPESLIGDRAQWKAGNRARLPDIQAEAKHGIYDTLHGFTDGAKLSEHINRAAAKKYGTAGRALIRQILSDGKEAAAETIEATRARYLEALPPMEGQARRIARRFTLLAAVLEYAAPITGLKTGGAAVMQCFHEWLEENGTGDREAEAICSQLDDFIAQYADSPRFLSWSERDAPYTMTGGKGKGHAGFKVQVGGNDEFYILPLVFREEIAQSFPIHTVCKVLSEKGRLKPSKNGYQHQIKVNKKPIRHYLIIEPLELD
ncbi:DUF927 domain-containing protein [Neisseria cinerea]